jgi:hypothetical protein
MQTKLCCIPCEQIVAVCLTKNYICAVSHCAKLQILKYKDIYLQISTLANTLNFFMHVHIIVNS